MTQEEALSFVYNSDTSKLFCYQEEFNMETEKVEGISRELYLPDKCLKLDMDNYFIIGYSSYKCRNPNELLKRSLTLEIINKNYQKIDSLLVYTASDYEADLTGLLNPKNYKVFVIGSMDNNKTIQAVIYTINDQTLKFERLKENQNIKGFPDDLIQALEILGWKEDFMN